MPKKAIKLRKPTQAQLDYILWVIPETARDVENRFYIRRMRSNYVFEIADLVSREIADNYISQELPDDE